jgi:tRNA U34 5-carboxymethylaminomethyl modifying GTPase MnmE/TrmE
VVVAGKVDIGGSLAYAQALRESLGKDAPEVLPFSAVTGEGLGAIRAAIRAVYEEAEAPEGDEVLLVNARHARCAADALHRSGRPGKR